MLKKYNGFFFLAVILVFSACASTQVSRTDKLSDVNGDWNPNDVQVACNELLQKCLSDPRIDQYVNDFAKKHGGDNPAVIVLSFKNATSEHIDTAIISNKMRNVILNSGRLEFVEGGEAREQIREERSDQNNNNASAESAARIGKELGANLALYGDVRSIVNTEGNKQTRSYYINANIANTETNRLIWADGVEINKSIKKSAFKL
jgi:uncharacterized protein (TIGR02722 family)